MDLKIENTVRYHIKPGYVLRELAGEYAIVPVDADGLITNAVMVPNESAVFMWKAFQQPSTIDDIVKIGIEEYEVDEETIRGSISRFVKESIELGIMEDE